MNETVEAARGRGAAPRDELVEAPPSDAPEALEERVVRYYSEATQDYRAWSRGFHMHFGYWRRGINPLRREAMLEEMTRQAVQRLRLEGELPGRVLDLGCGLGASARWLARNVPGAEIDAITLVPWQVEKARAMTAEAGLEARVRIHQADYRATPFAGAAYDAALALESACHDRGTAKEGFVREAARLLKPGGRLVVADGFLKGDGPLSPPLRALVRRACDGWALDCFPEIGAFTACLRRHGFEELQIEEISLRIAPSVAHVPWVTAKFLARELAASQLRLSGVRWRHLAACLASPAIGLARRRFGYFLLTARRSYQTSQLGSRRMAEPSSQAKTSAKAGRFDSGPLTRNSGGE